MKAITLSKKPESDEMVIHICGECDFRIKASKYFLSSIIYCSRTGIMNAIKIFYLSREKQNIPIYGVVNFTELIYIQPQKHLIEYAA